MCVLLMKLQQACDERNNLTFLVTLPHLLENSWPVSKTSLSQSKSVLLGAALHTLRQTNVCVSSHFHILNITLFTYDGIAGLSCCLM